MENWVDCVRPQNPNASVDIGYRSAIAAHMANLSYRNKKKMTFEEARAMCRSSRCQQIEQGSGL